MMDMNNTNSTARREYDNAMISLGAAERLAEILSAHVDEAYDNDYLAAAIQEATDRVAEMEADLADVQDRFTPEQCGV
jgi:uncharacterized protein (DUF2164 family)